MTLVTSRILTICFHGIGTPRRTLEPGEERFWITDAHFRSILHAIIGHTRRTDITFDDGNASDHVFGLPEMVRHGIPARFFIITDRIGEPGSLSEEQIREMADKGMRFGTHGASHRPWPGLLEDGQLDDELDRSTSALAALVRRPVMEAAFPQGLYDRRVLSALRRYGITRAFSVDEGMSRERSWLRTRYSVIHTDTAETITALLDSPWTTTDPWPVRPVKQAVKRWR